MRRITLITAAALAATSLAACGAARTEAPGVTSPGQSAPSDSGAATGPADDTSQEPATQDPADDATDEGGDTAAPDAPAAGETAEWRVYPEGQELVYERDGHASVLFTLPDEGESVFRAAAVRPGGTADDFTVVVVTAAEGMFDLRWMRVIEGEAGDLQLFAAAHNLGQAAHAGVYGQRVPAPVWAPDGTSLAWAEPGDDGAVLRTIGWSDGPGTGQTATDNAAFGLEQVPNDAVATSWEAGADTRTIVQLQGADGTSYPVHLDRQADGAWALVGSTGAA